MTIYIKTASIITASLFMVGCADAFISQARLYPNNDIATETGVLSISYEDYGLGYGQVSAVMPDGESLKGEYSTVDTSTYAFGSIYSTVYGAGGAATGYGHGTTVVTTGSSPGIVTLYGDNGTRMNCEYLVSNTTGAGVGVCQSSNGATYKLHF